MSYAVLHMTKINANNFGGKIKHNSREMKQTEKNENIDFSKSHLNSYDGIKTLQEFYTYKRENIDPLITRKDNVILNEIILSASPEFFENKPKEEITKWYKENIEFLKQKFGGKYIGSALHMDEKTPHIHAYIVPIQVSLNEENKEVKKLCSKEIFTRQSLIALQDDYPKFLQAKGYKLNRGTKDNAVKHTDQKEYSKAMNKAIENEAKKEKAFISGIDEIIDKHSVFSSKKTLKEKIKEYTKENFKGVYIGGILAKRSKDTKDKVDALTDKNQALEVAKNEVVARLEDVTGKLRLSDYKLQQKTEEFETYKKFTDERLTELSALKIEKSKLSNDNKKLLETNKQLKNELIIEKLKANPTSYKNLPDNLRNDPLITYEAIKLNKSNENFIGKTLKEEIGNYEPMKYIQAFLLPEKFKEALATQTKTKGLVL